MKSGGEHPTDIMILCQDQYPSVVVLTLAGQVGCWYDSPTFRPIYSLIIYYTVSAISINIQDLPICLEHLLPLRLQVGVYSHQD